MALIVPEHRNRLGNVINELESLGGKAKTDFRLAYHSTGEAVVETSDDLYDKWAAKFAKGTDDAAADDAAADDGDSSSATPKSPRKSDGKSTPDAAESKSGKRR